MEFLDLAEITTTTTGTGAYDITGSAASGFQDFTGFSAGAEVPYRCSLGADYEIGMEKMSKGDYAGALEVLERFLDSNPDSHEALVSMAMCHANLGRMDEALRMIDRALGLTDRDPMIYEIQGDILSSLGRANEARSAWRRALKLNPNSRKLRAKIARGR